MALTLNEIYTSTKNKYSLNLLCGEAGLRNIINWVYVSEDINTADFLRGGELVVTTGLSFHDSSWLYDFIDRLIKHHTCGIIINIGTYILEENITKDILELCDKHNFPLFTMPWEIHIYDITHDYYNRIFQDAHIDSTITDAFLSLIRMDDNVNHSVKLLEDYNFLLEDNYCICVLSFSSSDNTFEDLHHNFLFSINSYLKIHQLKHHVALYKNTFLFICHNETLGEIQIIIENLFLHLKKYYKKLDFQIGIGSSIPNLRELSSSYAKALAALTMSTYHNRSIYSFEDMGFFKLLLSINDVNLLKDYANSYLDKLIKYDEIHHSNYLETLRQYLLHNGSIQLIASAMFCHRNTINYRIHMLKENMGYDLEDTKVRYDLMTSFYILDYLKILL